MIITASRSASLNETYPSWHWSRGGIHPKQMCHSYPQAWNPLCFKCLSRVTFQFLENALEKCTDWINLLYKEQQTTQFHSLSLCVPGQNFFWIWSVSYALICVVVFKMIVFTFKRLDFAAHTRNQSLSLARGRFSHFIYMVNVEIHT